jgi:hypothetical protein
VVIAQDCGSERPLWPFTCYAHSRGRPNDLIGDVSFEEVRWLQIQVCSV